MGRFNNPAVLKKAPPATTPASPVERRPAVAAARNALAGLSRWSAQPVQAVQSAAVIKGLPAPHLLVPEWAASDNALCRIGFWFALALLFTRVSLIHEFLTFGLGLKPYAIILLGPPAILMVVLSGGIQRCLRPRCGRYLVAFMIWIVLITPFSSWRRGSVDLLMTTFKTEMVMFFVIAGLTFTMRDVSRMTYAIAAGGAINIVVSRLFGTTWDGRYTLAFGSIANPNDFATHLILTLPFILMYALTGRHIVLRAAAYVFTLAGTALVLLTGSRAGILALAIATVFAFFKAGSTQRVALGIVMVSLFVIGLPLLPESVRARYQTIFGSSEDLQAESEVAIAEGSKRARTELLRASIELTLRNPILGVGPGQFTTAEDTLAQAAGHRKGHWQVSHNTYTEISSETGLIGFFMYVGALSSAILLVNRLYRRTAGDPRLRNVSNMAYCLLVAFVGFAVCIVFASMAYKYYVPMIVGLTAAFGMAAQREILAVETGGPRASS